LEDRCLLDAVPFTLGGDPRVHPSDFRVTVFASGINYPYSMLQLSDGSLLAGLSNPTGGNLYNSTGELRRFVDANGDGVADDAGTVLFSGLPGVVTSVRQAGNLCLVLSSLPGSEQIAVLRFGATPADQLSSVGTIRFSFLANWEHTTFELDTRPTPGGGAGDYDVFWNIGSFENDKKTTSTVGASGLLTGTLNGDAIYMASLHDNGSTVTFSNLTQVATGLRNAAGMTFQPGTGDFYFQDNGIDGGGNPEEELSADEIDKIAAADIGNGIADFGFPDTYTDYFTGQQVGTSGIPPLVAFVPGTGPEVAGAVKVVTSPPLFPTGLTNGLLVGFHGIFDGGGPANDENSVDYVDLNTNTFFPIIAAGTPGVGHLDGLLSTNDSVFVADLSSNGDVFSSTGTGVIYQIKSINPANQPPVINPIPAQTAAEGSLVQVKATASDPDSGQTLTFSLGAGAPTGATIDPSSGQFSFTPPDGPASYDITVVVTDNGTPALSDSTDLIIHVNPVPPTLTLHGIGTVIVGTPFTLQLSHSDPDQDPTTSWSISWGDGSTTTVPGDPSQTTHVYTSTTQTRFTIAATATDADGTYTAPSITVVVGAGTPVTISGDASATPGQLYTLSLATNDPTDTIRQWTIAWGDGLLETVEGNPDSVTHTYPLVCATYSVIAVAGADGGLLTSNSLSVQAELPTQAECYVAQLYMDLLGRAPEPPGLADWAGLLGQGVSRAQVALGIESSPEYRTRLITGWYQMFLGRAPDPVGLNSFLTILNSPPAPGAMDRLLEAKALLLGSAEYYSRRGGGTNLGYLQALYIDVLARPLDQGGASAFGAELNAGVSPAIVAGQLLSSREGDQHLVQGYYQRYLRRPADAVSLNLWTNQLIAGESEEQVLLAILASNEYANRV
jgi:glucose/arabinose dehydrogenase